jgi:galactose mutarotase-like enzyme
MTHAHSPHPGPIDASAGTPEDIALVDEASACRVTLRPSRGAIVTSFRVDARELLYLDASTLDDSSKNVRGGIPLLFPSPGKLDGDAWSRAGRSGSMRQHGFARTSPWRVCTRAHTTAPSVRLALTSDDATRAAYPFDFAVELTYALAGTTLRIDHVVENRGKDPMPFAFGFHPYFLVRDKARARIATAATRAFDNVTKTEVPFTGFEGRFDLTAEEVDVHLHDHGSTTSRLTLDDGASITIAASPEYTRWVVWTQRGKDFVCVEPWTAPGNALNSGESLLVLAPGARRALWTSLAFTPAPAP